jgi:hypothetical protein
MKDMHFCSRTDPEWTFAWKTIAELPINAGLRDPTVAEHKESGEHWQYMGTHYHDDSWFHEFRHRWHPTTGKREYHNFRASGGFEHKHTRARRAA